MSLGNTCVLLFWVYLKLLYCLSLVPINCLLVEEILFGVCPVDVAQIKG